MSEHLRDFTKAVYGFDHVVRSVSAGAWDGPSPCEGWTGRHVVGHAIGVLRLVEAGARGTDPVGAGLEPRDIAGADPVTAWAEARDAVLESLDHEGVLHKVVQTPFGEMPIDAFLGIIFIDTLVHTWDLARSVGGDDRLDPALVRKATAVITPLGDAIRGPGRFAAAVAPPANADDQTALLCFLGRPV